MSIGLYIVLAPLYLKSVRKLQEKRFVFVKILAIIIPENGAKVSKIKCFQFAQQTLFNSMSFSNGANRDTELQVIVYQYWNIDEVVAEIKAEHNQINGTPTTLTINLHRSKWSFHNGYEPFYTTTINYD